VVITQRLKTLLSFFGMLYNPPIEAWCGGCVTSPSASLWCNNVIGFKRAIATTQAVPDANRSDNRECAFSKPLHEIAPWKDD
jgi:hypothetical protein